MFGMGISKIIPAKSIPSKTAIHEVGASLLINDTIRNLGNLSGKVVGYP
jgi:hypothetical protein